MSACGASCGITKLRAKQYERARADAARCLAAGALGAPFEAEQLRQWALEFESVLPCFTVWCDASASAALWLYLVPSVDGRGWVATREEGRPPPGSSRETVLRVGFSLAGRYATLQECQFEAHREAAGWWIVETPKVGVEDRRLQSFVKVAQGVLQRDRFVWLDANFLGEALSAEGPRVWDVLFDANPIETPVGCYCPDGSRDDALRRDATMALSDVSAGRGA